MCCYKHSIRILQTLFLFCISSSIFMQSATANQQLLTPASTAQITKGIEDIRKRTHTPGISIGLTYPDGMSGFSTWQYQSGVADLQSRDKLQSDHLFRTGSVSKMLVAIAILQLIEKQQLTLQSRLKDVLPDLAFHNSWQDSQPLLVAHLLNHSSGWDAPHFAANIPQSEQPITIEHALAIRPETRESRWPPGSRTAYNNTGYLVLAAIVEHISKIPFEQYVKRNILQPLDMHNSDYYFTDHYAQHAVSHYKGSKKVPYIHINNRASGALNSNAEDLLKLVSMMLSKDQRVLSNGSKQLMMSPSFSHYSAEGIKVGWGFGVTQLTRGGIRWFGHEGSIQGAGAFVGWNPELQLGITILVNTEGPAISIILNKLGELLQNLNPSEKNETKNNLFTDTHRALSGTYLSLNPTSSKAKLMSALPWKLIVAKDKAFIKPFGAKPRELLAGNNGTLLHAATGQTVLSEGKDPIKGDVIYYGPNTLVEANAVKAWLPLISIVLFVISAFIIFLSGLIWLPVWLIKRKTSHQLSKPQLLHRGIPLVNTVLLIFTALILKAGSQSLTPFKLLGEPGIYSISLFLCSVIIPLLVLCHGYVYLQSRSEIAMKTNGFLNKFSGAVAWLHMLFGVPFVLVMLSLGYLGIMTWW